MQTFFQQVFQILTTSPGNLAYHLVLAFAVAGALQASLSHGHSQGRAIENRTVLGLSLLLTFRLALFAAAALIWQGLIPADLMPPIDRTVNLLSLVLIIWLWVFPEPQRLADAANLLLALLVIIFSALTFVWWSGQGLELDYNGSWIDMGGDAVAMLLILLGGLSLVFQRPHGWTYGLGMLLILFAGHLVHWLDPIAGDYPGAVRLAQMAAYPLLLALPQRFPAPAGAPAPEAIQLSEQRQLSLTDPQALQAFLDLATQSSPEKICADMTQTTAQVMGADIALLVSLPEDTAQPATILCGYNLVQKEAIGEIVLSAQPVPTLTSTLHRGRPLRLPASSTNADTVAISLALGVSRIGHLLAAPLLLSEKHPLLGIVLLAPYSNRAWSAEDQAYLSSAAEVLARILHQYRQIERWQNPAQAEQPTQASTGGQAAQVQRERETLLSQLEAARQQAETERARAESLAALVATQEGSQAAGAQLEAEITRLKAELAGKPAAMPGSEVEHLEDKLRLALVEVAHLKAVLSDTEKKAQQSETGSTALQIPGEQMLVISSIAQEIRQPLASIVGYTDLLLGESVGILGALQRKFLERIKISIERMSTLVDDLIQASTSESGPHALDAETCDLNTVIDEAIAFTINQLREKNIILRVDLADQLPPIRAERDAVQQMLIHLLQNAGSASPVEGEISLHANMESGEANRDYVLVQVSDTGGGIAPEDLPRVFARIYRPDSPHIAGLGEGGVGLSVVKSLVESQGGRIWVDNQAGQGATFSVLLPIMGNGTPTDPKRKPE